MTEKISEPLPSGPVGSRKAPPIPYATTAADACSNGQCCLSYAHSGPCLTEGPRWHLPLSQTYFVNPEAVGE